MTNIELKYETTASVKNYINTYRDIYVLSGQRSRKMQ